MPMLHSLKFHSLSSSSRQFVSSEDGLQDKEEDYWNCSVMSYIDHIHAQWLLAAESWCEWSSIKAEAN